MRIVGTRRVHEGGIGGDLAVRAHGARAVRLEGIGGMRGVAESERSGDPAGGDRARGVGGDGDRARAQQERRGRSEGQAGRARTEGGAIDASVNTARGGVALGREEGCALGARSVHPRGIHGVATRGNARRRVRGVGECDGMLQRCYLARSRVREKVGLAGPPRLGPAVRTVRRRKSDRQKVDAWTRPFRVSSSEKKSSVD